MNLTSPSQVKDWCISNGFHPNKVLGQNFLIDKNALDSILDAALIAPSVSDHSISVQQTENSPCHRGSTSSVFCAADLLY